MFAPAAPAPLSYGPVQKYRYACCGASAAPRSTRDAHVAEPRIAYRVRLEASTAAPHQAHRPFLGEPLKRGPGSGDLHAPVRQRGAQPGGPGAEAVEGEAAELVGGRLLPGVALL